MRYWYKAHVPLSEVMDYYKCESLYIFSFPSFAQAVKLNKTMRCVQIEFMDRFAIDSLFLLL